MSDTRYPTRMHEILTKPGEPPLRTGEVFTVAWTDTTVDYALNYHGEPELVEERDCDGYCSPASSYDVVYMINNPERITRRPRLTQEQVRQMRALVTLGYRWLIKDSTDAVFAYVTRPAKQSKWWNCGGANVRIFIDLPPGILTSLVYWSDPEPLDILRVLQENGAFKEGG